jgi:glycerol-3-phosphate acyltransferase PlsX
MTVTVAVDANGADRGPAEVAAGAALAAAGGIRILLFGPGDALRAEVDGTPGLEIVDAPLSIAKAADPVRAFRNNPEASIVQAARSVAVGDADALVSGGSTGAALAAGLFDIKRARGIHRPALAAAVPVPGHPVTFLDVGANADVRTEHLVQFAYMGAALASVVLGVADPRVALLSNGEEPTRGSAMVQEAHARLAEASGLRFIGNIEGTQVTAGAADVVVADGFTGNVALKVMEGTSRTVLDGVRAAAGSSARTRAGGLLLRPALRALRDELDPERSGGAYLLGLRRLGVIPHGRFGRQGFANAIELAARGVTGDVIGRTHAALEAAGALRRGPGARRGDAEGQPSGASSSVPWA